MASEDDEVLEDADDALIYKDHEADLGENSELEDSAWESGGYDY